MGTKRTVPTGGKKGGSVFPRYDLESAVVAAKRLVSKSHIGPIAKDLYVSGVLQATGPRADIKSSSLKQYGFLLGSSKHGFQASDIAKQVALGGEDAAPALRKAALHPRVFSKMHEPFSGDSVSKAKLKQRAAQLGVHPDMLDLCVKIYVDSLTTAGLVRVEGDQVVHLAKPVAPIPSDEEAQVSDSGQASDLGSDHQDDTSQSASSVEQSVSKDREQDKRLGLTGMRTGRALINVNITLDSSLDTEKLEKQLALLKKFGAI